MAKKYFVQTKYPDGELGGSMNTASQIIDMFGFRDCTDCDFEVFDITVAFGSMVRLIYEPATKAPFNYHRFINSATKYIEFEGFSPEH